MTHFLLIYDRAKRRLVSHVAFSDVEEATAAYDAAEVEHLGDQEVEVVLVGGDSLESVKHTHGQYFESGSAGARAQVGRRRGRRPRPGSRRESPHAGAT